MGGDFGVLKFELGKVEERERDRGFGAMDFEMVLWWLSCELLVVALFNGWSKI